MVECIGEGWIIITGLWWGLVVSDGLNGLPQAPCVSAVREVIVDFLSMSSQVKSSHLYLYSAFNNTNCDKATAQYQNGKIVSIM